MLLRIKLENFFSIKNRICLDFIAAKSNSAQARDLAYNVIDWNGTKVLKSIGLFGPNASGKSNILKAITFCCGMILESHLHNEGVIFNFMPFKFDGYDKKPSEFLIDFVCGGIEYEYSFALTRNEVIRESLYYYPKGKRAKIFTRDEGSDKVYTFTAGIILKPNDVAVNTSRKNLFLSRASSMNRDLAQRLYRYFLKTFLLGMVDLNNVSAVEENFNAYKKVILKALAICDTDITDIRVRHEQIPAPLMPSAGNPDLNFRMVDILRFQTIHKRSPEVVFDLDVEESNGTRKLFQILLRLLDVVRNKKSLIMDEFDVGLHTRLADFILDLIHASESSQLLFTSHNTNLIDMKRLRKDQIVFVNKQEDGSTEVYSLYDYKDFRENMDAEKGYIQGRFDAVPFIDSTVMNLKSLMEE